nr:T9SS type A sorting domain-containing protein [Bacteroidota bacterium]
MKKIIGLILICGISVNIVHAQSTIYYPNIIWQKGYGGYGGEDNHNNFKSTMLKVDNDIYLTWNTGTDSSGNITTHRCFYPGGIWSSPNSILFKIDTSGSITAQSRFSVGRVPQLYNNTSKYVYNDIAVLNDDRILILTENKSGIGCSQTKFMHDTFEVGNQVLKPDAWVIYYDRNLVQTGDSMYGSYSWDDAESFIQKGENVFIAGATDADSSGDITTHPFNIINAYNSDLYIMQFDTMMNKINDCRLGGDSAEFRFIFGDNGADSRLLWMAQTNSNVGYDITEPSRGKLDIWAGLSNNNCNIVWQKRVGSTSLDIPIRIFRNNNDGGYDIFANTLCDTAAFEHQSISNGLYDFWLVKLDSIGNYLWDMSIGGNGTDQLSDVCRSNDGGYVLLGTSNSDSGFYKSSNAINGTDDYWVVKLDSNYNKMWDVTIGGDYVEEASGIDALDDGSYVVSGVSGSDTGYYKTVQLFDSIPPYSTPQIWVLRFKVDSLYAAGGVQLLDLPPLQLFPNPAQGILNICGLPMPLTQAKIIFTDALGREVKKTNTVVNGGCIRSINVSDLPSGFYSAFVDSGGYVFKGRFVK